jgi:hypothetical protein
MQDGEETAAEAVLLRFGLHALRPRSLGERTNNHALLRDTAKTLYDVDKNSLSIPRTTSQVLNIVYGGGRCSGGFFPNGMNGTIVCQGQASVSLNRK